nr:hypothetical protein [Tanacetum cinerariifolium]
DDVPPAKEQPLPATVSPTAEPPGYIIDLEPKMDPEEEDGDDKESEEDSIDYLTSRGDDDADGDGDDLSKDDANDEDKEESSDSKEEEEEHIAPTVPAPALHSKSSVAAARQIKPTLTVAESRRAEDRLIGRLRRASTLVTQIVALQRDVSTLQRQQINDKDRLTRHIQHEHAQRDKMAPKRARTTRANPDPTTTATEPMTQEAINNLIPQHVTKALAEYDTQRNSVVNEDTSHATRTGPRIVHPTRECTYKDYLNYRPLKFKCTEGVISLTQWFERTESVFSISNYTAKNQVKFVSCTLIGSALTWWYSYIRAVSQEVAYAIHWKTLSYTLHFQELTLLYGRMFLKESDEIERYVGGLPEMIRGNVMSYEPKSMQKAIESVNDQMDQKLLGTADRQADNKRKFDNTSRNQQNQQPFKRNDNVAWAYAAGSRENKPYRGTKPLCHKCNFYHDGPCRPKCTNCKRTVYIARDCRSRAANTNNNSNNNCNNQRATTAYQKVGK